MKSGRLKALAISSAQRVVVFPDTPTFVESGFPGMAIASWSVLDAPRATPAPVVQALRAAAGKVVRSPAFLRPFEAEGNTAVDLSPQEFEAFVRAETERWAQVIRSAGIRID